MKNFFSSLQEKDEDDNKKRSKPTKSPFNTTQRPPKGTQSLSIPPIHRRTRSDSDSIPQSPTTGQTTRRADGTNSAPPANTNMEGEEMGLLRSFGAVKLGRGESPLGLGLESQFPLLRRHDEVKAMVGQYIGLQEDDYHQRYTDLPHAQRTLDIVAFNASTNDRSVTNFSMPNTSSAHQRALMRAWSAWELRKRLLIDSVEYKDYCALQKLKNDGWMYDNFLLHFIALLIADGERGVEWPEETMARRAFNAERGVHARKVSEGTKGLMYSFSGPSVRKKKLEEAEKRLGIKGQVVKMPQRLRVRRGRSGSMEVLVGEVPRRSSENAVESAGLESTFSDGERDDAHVNALRIALDAMSVDSPTPASRTTSRDFAIDTVTNPERDLVPRPLRDSARDNPNWEPISQEDQQQEELDRRRSREVSTDEGWGSDSDEIVSDDEANEKPGDKETVEARKLDKDEKAKEKRKAVSQKEKEKTSIAESFPGRSFF